MGNVVGQILCVYVLKTAVLALTFPDSDAVKSCGDIQLSPIPLSGDFISYGDGR